MSSDNAAKAVFRLKPSARWKSQALPEFQFLLDFANGTGGGIALSVLQHNQVLALEHWLKLLDLVNVDDYRTADAQESLRGEMGFQRTHGLAQDMILLADMHYSVFSGGLDGLDLVHLHKGNLAWGFDSQSSELTCRCRRLTQEREKPAGGDAGLFVGNELPRPLDRFLEPSGLEWL